MKTLPVYENLDTSFVNLSALLRYLRARNFAGKISVELEDFEAEINLGADDSLVVREHNFRAGRIAEGEEALQRLLIRARAPGGKINVFRFAEETASEKNQVSAQSSNGNFMAAENFKAEILSGGSAPKKNAREFSVKSESPKKAEITIAPPKKNQIPDAPEKPAPLPLEFTNRVEARARRAQILPQDWQTLLELTGELFGAIDEVLIEANLDFVAPLTKARAEIAADYPFLNPSADRFFYAAGQIQMRGAQPNIKIFAAGINESLRRILEKLGANPKFAETYRRAVQQILALIHRRRALYEQFFTTPQLEKIVGA